MSFSQSKGLKKQIGRKGVAVGECKLKKREKRLVQSTASRLDNLIPLIYVVFISFQMKILYICTLVCSVKESSQLKCITHINKMVFNEIQGFQIISDFNNVDFRPRGLLHRFPIRKLDTSVTRNLFPGREAKCIYM